MVGQRWMCVCLFEPSLQPDKVVLSVARMIAAFAEIADDRSRSADRIPFAAFIYSDRRPVQQKTMFAHSE